MMMMREPPQSCLLNNTLARVAPAPRTESARARAPKAAANAAGAAFGAHECRARSLAAASVCRCWRRRRPDSRATTTDGRPYRWRPIRGANCVRPSGLRPPAGRPGTGATKSEPRRSHTRARCLMVRANGLSSGRRSCVSRPSLCVQNKHTRKSLERPVCSGTFGSAAGQPLGQPHTLCLSVSTRRIARAWQQVEPSGSSPEETGAASTLIMRVSEQMRDT